MAGAFTTIRTKKTGNGQDTVRAVINGNLTTRHQQNDKHTIEEMKEKAGKL